MSLGLEFILQDDTAHDDRASCSQAFYQIERWKNFLRYDPPTKENQAPHLILDSDPKLSEVPFPRRNLSEERGLVEKVLNSPRYLRDAVNRGSLSETVTSHEGNESGMYNLLIIYGAPGGT